LIFGIVSWSECYSSCIECKRLKTWMPMNEMVGGIYSPQPLPSRWQRLLAMGTPDSPVRHRTVTVYCPVCTTSARLLGFGAVDRWRRLSFCCTGQSGATPDSPMISYFCRGTVHLTKQSLAQGSRCSVGSPDSPVNYSGARLQISEPDSVAVRAWCTGQCPVHTRQCPGHQISAHSSSLL
jgi:hypothetical protein